MFVIQYQYVVRKKKKARSFESRDGGEGDRGNTSIALLYIYMPEYINKYINSSEKRGGGSLGIQLE